MIYTITLNPAIDKTIVVDALNFVDVTRVKKTVKDAAGKGINVSKTIQTINQNTIVTGIIAGDNGSYIKKKLADLQIKNILVETIGETRENMKIFSLNDNKVLEINETGPIVSMDIVDALMNKIDEVINPNDWIVISGSLPPGLSSDTYKKIIMYYQEKGVKCLLDVSGIAFREALLARPNIIKPNRYELEVYANSKLDTIESIIDTANDIIKLGVEHVFCSLGSKGSVYVSKDKIYQVIAKKIDSTFTVGAGDAFVGGLIAKFDELSIIDVLKLATASAQAAIKTEGTKAGDIEMIKTLITDVKIQEIRKDNNNEN